MIISVIIPIYNAEKYLEQCLDSILNQKENDIEVILVDDGSTDQSGEMCDDYRKKDSRIKVIHKKNEGVSLARKAGVDIALGEYIICVDADDYVADGLFEEIINIATNNKVDLICYNYFEDKGNMEFVEQRSKCHSGLYEKENIIKNIYPYLIQTCKGEYFTSSLWNKAVRKELLEKYILCNRKATIGEDMATIVACIYNASSIFISDKKLYYYRYNNESATKSKKVFNWEWPEIVNRHIEKCIDIQKYNFQEQLYRKITHDVFNVVITQFYQDKAYAKIVREIKIHLKNDYYKNAISQAKFSGSIKAKIMECVMKLNLFFIMKIYSEIR